MHNLSINKINIKEEGEKMFNLHSKKSKKIISTIIIILLVLSMTLPTILSIFY